MALRYEWPNNAKLALSIVVNVEEGAEMSLAEGDKKPEPVDELGIALQIPIRNYVNESNYQYGINAGGPRVLDLLSANQIPTTFTAAAVSLERAPKLTERIVADGHEVCAHGWRWVHQFSFKEDKERDFIRSAADCIERSTGTRPAGWLSRYLHTDRTRRLLLEEGFTYHMDDVSDDLPKWEHIIMSDGTYRPIVCVPYAIDTNDMKFWTSPSYTPDQWLTYLVNSLDWLLAETETQGPRMLSVGVHLRIIGRPGRIWALAKFLDYAKSKPGVWFAKRADIARLFAEQNPKNAHAQSPS
ncbi:MAG: polysaccharide deacetylase family protein [Hyphomicrobiaceae bacterium]